MHCKIYHGFSFAYELARYALGSIPLETVHLYWTRLSFNDMGFIDQNEEFCLQQEFDAISQRLKEVDIVGKITIKSKFREIAFLDDFCVSTC